NGGIDPEPCSRRSWLIKRSIAMRELAFYEAGYHEVKGIRRAVIPFRRLLRRLLRPIFLQLDAELRSLARRHDEFDRELKAVRAMGWDHVALARRLAVLEDHVDAILTAEAT